MGFIKVCNMMGQSGEVKNQFLITTKEGIFFQSYDSIIVFKDQNNNVFLDEHYYNYSKTTSKYRNQFLGKSTKEIEKLINQGVYKLVNLNK